MDKIKRVKELVIQLNIYRNAYYNNSESQISDYEYDNLFDELKQLEDETGVIMSNSPTQTVGYEVKSELETVKHSHAMLSLDKTKSVDDLRKFAGDEDSLLSLKMDGLTILLTYENGELVQAETRGNGEEGEIVTHNARVFKNIPLYIDYLGHFETEGEAVITYEDFERINKPLVEKAIKEATEKGLQGKEFDKYVKDNSYANPRSLASGSVRQLDSGIAAQRNIRFVAWKVPTIEDEIKSDNSFLFRLQFAKKLGFDIVPFYTYTNKSSDSENLEAMIESLKNQAKEKDYPIDGLVMTYNNIAYGESLGKTGHHPKHSIAFKFYDEEVTTNLLDIEWTMGKTGILTPTAIFNTVEIDGTSVERASLHNISVMKELGVCARYQEVNVYKANQIIPQIASAEKLPFEIGTYDELIFNNGIGKAYEGKIQLFIPEKCPICEGKTSIIKENSSEVLVCDNSECKGKLLGKLSHFVSKNAVNIDGLSEQTLERFIELGWLKSFQDIYKLSEHKDEMSELDGFGKRSVEKLLDAIEKSRSIKLSNLIYSLCIPLIGRSASKDIAKECNNDVFTFIDFMNVDYDFIIMDGFGTEMQKSLSNWWEHNEGVFCDLIEEFTFEKVEEKNSGVDLNGKTFVITGSLTHYKNRDELVSVIEQLGGRVSGSVSAKTSYLINNDVASTSGKNKKAKDLGIPIISEEDFLKMIG